jgi:hypothetical protein
VYATVPTNETHDERLCVKCGSELVRVIGQSVSPAVFFVTCGACGHSSALASSARPPEPSPTGIDAAQIERDVRRIVADFDLPVEVIGVSDAVSGWQIMLKTRSQRIIPVRVATTETDVIRSVITRALAHA